jgi:hypothetical protein
MKRYRDEDREAVRAVRAEGLVPAAIADELEMSDLTVARHLRAIRRGHGAPWAESSGA